MFNGNAQNIATITGNATFNDTSVNDEIINGDATFNEYSTNSGTVNGDAFFACYADNNGTVTGTITTGACPTNFYWYSDGSDVSWTTLSNWWLDAGHTIAAPELPDSTKAVITVGSYAPVVDVSTWVEPENIDASATGISFTSSTSQSVVHNPVTGAATFSDEAINGTIITGDAVFNDLSSNTNFGGVITGNAIFNDSSFNFGTITGDAVFNGASYNA